MSDEIIRLDKVNKGFRSGFLSQKKQILFDVSFSIKRGSVVGFIGSNGAGKSTTMKTMLGLVKPDSGQIYFFGQNKLKPSLFERIGFLPERPQFYKFLSGEELLVYYGKLSKKFSNKELKSRVSQVLEEVNLTSVKDQLIGSYSKGMNQRIGIAQALLHRPEFIILDEPLSGLDPDGRYELSQIIKKAAQSGASILFSSHLLDDTEKICDSIVIIKQGRIKYSGSMENLIQSHEKGFVVNYMQKGIVVSVEVEQQEMLSSKLKELSQSGLQILNIQRKKRSLEEAYVNVVTK